MYRLKGLTSYQKKTILKAFKAFSEIDVLTRGSLNFSNLRHKHLNELVISYLNSHGVTTSHGKPFNLRRLRQFYQAIRPHKDEVIKLLLEAEIIKPNELNDELEDDLGVEDTLAPYQSFIREAEGYNTDAYQEDIDQYLLDSPTPEAPPPPTQLSKKEAEINIQELYSNLRAEDGSPLYEKRYFRKHIRSYTDLDPII